MAARAPRLGQAYGGNRGECGEYTLQTSSIEALTIGLFALYFKAVRRDVGKTL
jgi:hypothetical protein